MAKTFLHSIFFLSFYWLKRASLVALFMGVGVNVFAQQGITVKGVVVAQEDGSPLPGVAVKEKGTTNGMSANEKGEFVLSNVKPNATLVFSFVGYAPQEIPASTAQPIQVKLVADVANLEEVVVVGYGTVRKRDLTGAVSSVNTKKLENETPTQVSDVLRGNVAGVNIGFSARAKGGGSLQIRGRTSLNAGTSPLIVLDGAIFYGALEDINPSDIETIDVLKDASSAAVFGAKSASGVILVTTKKGKEGKPQINVNATTGLATMAVNQRVYDAANFTTWRSDYFRTSKVGAKPYQYNDPRALPADISVDDWLAYDDSHGDPVETWLRRLNMQPVEIANYKAGRSVDWYNLAFHNGLRQDYNVSVSGKNENISYYVGAGYLNNEGVIVDDQYKTLRTRANIEANITKFLTVGMNTQFSSKNESAIPYNWDAITSLSPWGSRYDDEGNLTWRPNNEASGGVNLGYDAFYTDRLYRTNSLNSTIFAKVKLPFGIQYQLNFTPQLELLDEYNAQSAQHEEWAGFGGRASRRQRETYYWQVDNLLKWDKTVADIHHFDVTFLVNAEKFQRWDNTMTNENFDPTDELGYHGIGSGIKPIVSSNDQYSTGDALMGRVVYSLKDRYMFTGTFRRDGYSAFGQKNPRANFGSVALGWVFTDEDFFKSDWFNYGKLRLSWGSNGNRDLGTDGLYNAIADLTTGKYLYVMPDGTVIQASQLYMERMQNRNLRWERNTSYNLGLDFGLFNNVLDGTVEVYQMNSTDLLVKRTLPDVSGFDWVMDNLGEVQNRGFEISLNSNNIQRDNLTWRTSFNFQLNRNQIKHIYRNYGADGQELDDVGNKWFVGHAIDAIWDWKALGVYQSSEAEQAARYELAPGDYHLEDVNDDGRFTNADKQFLGYTEPRFRWSLRNDFQLYKNFTFSFMIYSLWGHKATFNEMKNRNGFPDRMNAYAYPYWTPENQSTEWARIGSNEGSATGFNVYRDRSFIRLDNVSLAYTVPTEWTQRYNVKNLRLFFNVRNAAVYKKEWQLWDPEWDPDQGVGPTPRTFTFGLDVTL